MTTCWCGYEFNMLLVIKTICVQSLPLPQSQADRWNGHMLIGLPYKKCFMQLMGLWSDMLVKLLLVDVRTATGEG